MPVWTVSQIISHLHWQDTRDDHRIQSDYKCKSELQNPEGKTLHLVLRLRGETEHDTNDNVTTKTQTFYTAHMDTNM